ncbi:MAG: glucose-6-phosphate dehydrogenase, partial [Planctomycetota bacterium]
MSQPTVRATDSQRAQTPNSARRPKPCILILFGVTGDLSRRKLLPAIYELSSDGLLPENFAVVGFSRKVDEVEELRKRLRAGAEEHARTLPLQEEAWDRIADSLYATTGDADDPAAFEKLSKLLEEIDAKHGTEGRHLYYFATPASVFPMILDQMKGAGLLHRASAREELPRTRVVIEKPFG